MVDLFIYVEYKFIVDNLILLNVGFVDGGYWLVVMGVIFIMINLVNGDMFIDIVVYGFEDVDFVVIKVCEVFDDGCWFKMYLFECKDVLICFCKLMIWN